MEKRTQLYSDMVPLRRLTHGSAACAAAEGSRLAEDQRRRNGHSADFRKRAEDGILPLDVVGGA